MFRVSSRLNGLILLLTFVLTTVGSVPGFAWCIGEDGHFEIEYIATGDFGGGVTGSSGNMTGESSIQIDEDHCGPCLDFIFQSHEAMSANRPHHKTSKSHDVFALKIFPSITCQTVKLVVGNLVPQPPPRISQAILEHRTIVLLN